MNQQAELSRVQQRIGSLVREFVKERLATNRRQFYIRELHDYIFQKTQIAPASPDRILRQMRLNGECHYTVLSRRESLYELHT